MTSNFTPSLNSFLFYHIYIYQTDIYMSIFTVVLFTTAKRKEEITKYPSHAQGIDKRNTVLCIVYVYGGGGV